MRVVLAGATGTIGQATARALVQAGHDVICPVREGRQIAVPGVDSCVARYDDASALAKTVFSGPTPDAVISCLASRTGTPADAWAVDHDAQQILLSAAKQAGVTRFVLLSAICVQKPELAFQQAKLAFEASLQSSGLTWSIVRPTAFFKSLSGQVARIQSGRPFLLFGDGLQTACKPISDADLGRYLALCLTEQEMHNRVLPIGGPGPAITPRVQGETLFELAGRPPRFKHVPFALMDAIVGGLTLAGHVSRKAADKAQLARIGRYYATESMLFWDPVAQRYDAEATPEFGSDTLWAHYEAMLRGDIQTDLGAHAVF